MRKPFGKVLTVTLLVIAALYFLHTNDVILGLLMYFVLPFPMRPSFLMVLFWAITIGLVIAYVLWRKNIGNNRWGWVVLFAMEIFGLVCANVESSWGYVPVKYGWANLGLADCEVARRGVVFFFVAADRDTDHVLLLPQKQVPAATAETTQAGILRGCVRATIFLQRK